METVYNKIGMDYAQKRQSDPRLAALIHAQIPGLNSVLNVGAGAGSYEPENKNLIALEPSWRMIGQRPEGAAPCVCAVAEHLPFPDNSFEAGLALLTVHHWANMERGLDELQRVISKRLVIHTWDPAATEHYWLINDYIPELLELDAARFMKIEDLIAKFNTARLITVPIPDDCTDGFLGAYWARPQAYFDPVVKSGISSFQQISQSALDRGLSRLKTDLDNGLWLRRYAELAHKKKIDLGYRLIVVDL